MKKVFILKLDMFQSVLCHFQSDLQSFVSHSWKWHKKVTLGNGIRYKLLPKHVKFQNKNFFGLIIWKYLYHFCFYAHMNMLLPFNDIKFQVYIKLFSSIEGTQASSICKKGTRLLIKFINWLNCYIPIKALCFPT